ALRQRPEINLFAPLEHSGLLASPEARTVLSALETVGPKEPAALMRLCLQALRIQRDELAPRLLEAELVATLPPGTPGIARRRERVLREMLASSSREIILLGYELTDLDVIRVLAEAGARGAQVIMICDRARRAATMIRDAWPSNITPPALFQNRERTD